MIFFFFFFGRDVPKMHDNDTSIAPSIYRVYAYFSCVTEIYFRWKKYTCAMWVMGCACTTYVVVIVTVGNLCISLRIAWAWVWGWRCLDAGLPGTYAARNTHAHTSWILKILDSFFDILAVDGPLDPGCVNLMQYLWSTILFLSVTTFVRLVSALRLRHRVYFSIWLGSYDVWVVVQLVFVQRFVHFGIFASMDIFCFPFYGFRRWAPSNMGVNQFIYMFRACHRLNVNFGILIRLRSPCMWHSVVQTLYLQLRLNAKHTNFGRCLCAASHSQAAFVQFLDVVLSLKLTTFD